MVIIQIMVHQEEQILAAAAAVLEVMMNGVLMFRAQVVREL